MMGLRERVHQRVSPKDLPFRFRGTEPTRTEALADAVIGFSMTLAVVSLDVPDDSGDLLRIMRGFVTFALTFLVLFTVWLNHHRFNRRYGLEDDRTTWLTAGILFIVVFYTYPLKFVLSWLVDQRVGLGGPTVHRDDMLWIVSLYGLGFSALGLLFGALHRHALSLADLLELTEAERLETLLQSRAWFGSLWVGLPLAGTALLAASPRKTAAFAAGAIAYLLLLLGGTIRYALLAQGITKERERARACLAAPVPLPAGARSEGSA